MIGELPSDDTVQALENHLGEPFVIRHLHPLRVRFRRAYAQKALALPSALKLQTTSGGIYKLHVSDEARRFEHMKERAGQARATALFPDIVWQNEQALLLEFIPGSRPSFRSQDFASALGNAMAKLHQVEQKVCDVDRIDAGIKRDLALLADVNALGRATAWYADRIEEVRPARLLSSMDYADVRPGNFLVDDKGQLRFIDLGALRANRPAGQYLCGSFYLRLLDRKAFSEAYLAAGGLPQVIEQARFLRMLNCIWAAALYIRKMQEVPVYLPLHKFSYRFLAGYLIWEFRRLAGRQNVHFISI